MLAVALRLVAFMVHTAMGYGNDGSCISSTHACFNSSDEVLLVQKSSKHGSQGKSSGGRRWGSDAGEYALATCKPSTIYRGQLQNAGWNCWHQCGKQGGYCSYCGVGHVCCAPRGLHDEGCHKDVCRHTQDWSRVWYQRRRHHFCGSMPLAPMTPEDRSVDLPIVASSSKAEFDYDSSRLDIPLWVQDTFPDPIFDLVDFFDFIPSVRGYIAQYRLPKGDLQTTSCDLRPFLRTLRDHEKLDLIGAGYSYYIQKAMPRRPSINMQGCKCVEHDPLNGSVTVCAATTFGEALEHLLPKGVKVPTSGEYHHLSFGGAIAVFNHGSDYRHNSLVDTVKWMEYYNLATKRFERESDLGKIKELIANRTYVMTRANIELEPDPLVITFAKQSRGKHHIDDAFVASLDNVRSLDLFLRYKPDGSHVAEAFGYRALTKEQQDVLIKKGIAPHVCALRYRDCRLVDFFRGGDEIGDSDYIFGHSFELNGHIVKASDVEFYWGIADSFGKRFFGQHVGPTRGTKRSWEFEFCIKGLDLPALVRLWHAGVQSWPEQERLEHTMVARRGRCLTNTCYSWAGYYFHGHRDGFVKLWTHAAEVFGSYDIYVHLGKERVEEVKPYREISFP
eukprot:TRINITY_DN15147_c0_g1_i1.p1 TRINITY_DN15147_c0_g1~~TRINITY_DN15147_c0_g1_i1.p1  ORF type:complete len:617 (-),score=79.14 TRINITY_DN15147_c0_g1_i1:326-2176(-)